MARALSYVLLFSSVSWGGEYPPRKIPLDLPSGGLGRLEDSEDAPEVIHFFGGTYEGDGFFFLLDKSGSMRGDKMVLLKQEMTSTVNSLSRRSDIGAVAFSQNTVAFVNYPVSATFSNKARLIGWVNSLEPMGSTRMLEAAVAVLRIAALSRVSHRVIIVVGDGLPNLPGPEETLNGIVGSNWEDLPFNTILFGEEPQAMTFMRQLAYQSGGTFLSNPAP